MPIVIPEIKKEIDEMEYEVDVKPEISQVPDESRVESEDEEEIEEKKELDLEHIDMMQIPIQLDDGMDILEEVKCVKFLTHSYPTTFVRIKKINNNVYFIYCQ